VHPCLIHTNSTIYFYISPPAHAAAAAAPPPWQIDKNKLLVEELSAYLPDRRSELSAGVVRVSAALFAAWTKTSLCQQLCLFAQMLLKHA
jgi:hypothetical protein